MHRVAGIIALLLFLTALPAAGQGMRAVETRSLTPADSVLMLSADLIVQGSFSLTIDSVRLGSPGDYTLDHRFGVVRFTPSTLLLLADTSRPRLMRAIYSYRPIDLRREYARMKLVVREDSAGGRREVAEESGALTAAEIFGRNFQRSGSVVRGLTIGSNRDLTLQSGLRLQFSGNVAEDVEVLGAVTDEQTPIQPEGNTQTLREVDNIFIEVRSPFAGGTFGKFTAANGASEYTAFSRKLQGVRATARYGPYGGGEFIAAVAPGRFVTQQIQGRERDQGPYRLTGPTGERNIIVVAGTERVFVDGVEMTRGESNDYVIDYGTGEIFFQTRRPITSASRITVDFEYSDRRYSRSFIAFSNNGFLFDSSFTLSANYVREADNQDATIDLTLNDEDRALLASVGADPRRAVRSGVRFVGRNDTLNGTYYRIDTLINGAPDSVFVYAPTDPRSVYHVSFDAAPDGRGDYQSVAFGEYRFVGKGAGAYLPVVYLPLPELRQVVALKLGATPARGVSIAGELAFSDAALNRFSADPSSRLSGTAFTATATARRDSLTLGSVNLGSVVFNGNARYLDRKFRSVERLGDVEFNNRWNTGVRLAEGNTSDVIAEGNLTWFPLRPLELTASSGYLTRGAPERTVFTSFRQLYSARLAQESLPTADYTFERIATGDSVRGGLDGLWLKQRGGVNYRIGAFIPGFRFETEDREDRGTVGTDTLFPTSFRFFEAGPDLQIDLPFMSATARGRFRIDDSVRYDSSGGGRFLRDGTAQTYTFRGDLKGVRNLTSTADLTYRVKSYDSVAGLDPGSRLNSVTVLARSQTRWNGFSRGVDLEALYEVQTEQAARLQYIFQLVPIGQGEYIWIDLDSNGVQTENEFRLTNAGDGEYIRRSLRTEQLFPVIDLRTSARLRLQPKNMFGDSGVGAWLSPFTSETYLRVEEKSQAERESDIYLLRLSAFQDDSTTVTGNSVVQQDLHLFESNPDYNIRLRYQSRRGLIRLFNAIERTEATERSLRARWQPTFDIGLQLDLGGNSGLLRSTDTVSNRTYDLTTFTAASDFSYRPLQALELGWRLKVASTEDVLPAVPRRTFQNTNEVRGIYSIERLGSIRAEIERTNVTGQNLGTGDLYSLPYQLTDGYAVGETWVGRLSFDYSLSSSLQISVTYTGRAQPPSHRVIHLGQAEVRALF